MDTATPKLTPEQTAELTRLKQYFPFRIVWGAISPTGEWRCSANPTKRQANDLARKGWTVYFVTLYAHGKTEAKPTKSTPS